jgi:hypothetical protein
MRTIFTSLRTGIISQLKRAVTLGTVAYEAWRIAANIAKLPQRPAAMTYTHIANGQIASAADDERRFFPRLVAPAAQRSSKGKSLVTAR